jgi:transposase
VGLKKGGYRHKRIRHSARVYVMGTTHTQTIEGFFGNFKNGLRGNYHSVSRKWLQGYLNEWTFRWNHRKDETPMFWTLVSRVEKRPLAAE